MGKELDSVTSASALKHRYATNDHAKSVAIVNGKFDSIRVLINCKDFLFILIKRLLYRDNRDGI